MTTITRIHDAKSKLALCVTCIGVVALLSFESLMTATVTIHMRIQEVIKTGNNGQTNAHPIDNQMVPPPFDNNQQPHSPIHVNSSWIGNQWIPPPGYRLYSASEMQSFFQNHSILWMGDSTARRTYGTLYQILNETSHPDDLTVSDVDRPEVIDMNKKGGNFTEPCDKPGYTVCRHCSGGPYDYYNVPCTEQLLDSLQNRSSWFWNDISNYTLVIIIMGPHEMLGRCKGGVNNWESKIREFAQILATTQLAHAHIIWRTWGSIGSNDDVAANRSVQLSSRYNQVMMDAIDDYEESLHRHTTSKSLMSHVSYVDWGSVMVHRSFPQSKRIVGDITAHYGLEARLAFLQMLVNHLAVQVRGPLDLNAPPDSAVSIESR